MPNRYELVITAEAEVAPGECVCGETDCTTNHEETQ